MQQTRRRCHAGMQRRGVSGGSSICLSDGTGTRRAASGCLLSLRCRSHRELMGSAHSAVARSTCLRQRA
uniref:Uncharacterized protein n=1 Tax=uncultured marine virus TaxID=186617 RepID=A0A0F7L974_9VIRU|nr:hypothetical protein [uncultured marine virus]